MKVIAVVVMSLDGRLTKGYDPHIYNWTSKEDQQFFFDLMDRAKLIVMGRKTYEASRSQMKHTEGRLRIVMTRNPAKFAHLKKAGKLKFSDESPSELVKRLAGMKYDELLLVGGVSEFFKLNLVDVLYVTIEPRLFGVGKSFVHLTKLDTRLTLEKMKVVNKQGTIILKYTVEK